MEESTDPQLWHGGAPGIPVGKRIRPAAGLSMPAQYLLASYVADSTKVYVTSDRLLATHYAAAWAGINAGTAAGGTLYRVVPSGPLDDDPDYDQAPGLSYTCRFAVVAEVAEVGVLPTFEIELYGRSFNTWWDGSKMYDSLGHLRATPEMLDVGISHEDMRSFGPHPNLEIAAKWVMDNFDVKIR